jgi:hypothetical protein
MHNFTHSFDYIVLGILIACRQLHLRRLRALAYLLH